VVLWDLIFGEHVLVEESPAQRRSLGTIVLNAMTAALTAFAPVTGAAVAVADTADDAQMTMVVGGATTVLVGATGLPWRWRRNGRELRPGACGTRTRRGPVTAGETTRRPYSDWIWKAFRPAYERPFRVDAGG
jgi:hypothetical protein